MAVDFGQGITPEDCPDSDVIACTLNETSTGVIVDRLPEVGTETLLCVDATSGGGQVACDVSKVDVFFFSPQKVFASEGAPISPLCHPRRERASQNRRRQVALRSRNHELEKRHRK